MKLTSYPQLLGSSYRVCSLLTSALLGLTSATSCFASGFSLYGEANGRNAGDYAAGAAAEAIDASTLFYNPAGLVALKGQQLVFGGHIVHLNLKLKDGATSEWTTTNNPNAKYTQSIAGEQSTKTAPVPAFYYAHSVTPNLSWGLGVYAPFGLETNWGEHSETRYAATKTKLEIINVSPAIAGRLTKNLSVGAALDLQIAQVEFNSVAGLPVNNNPPTQWDTTSHNSGHSFGVGAHAGLLYQLSDKARVGLNYQSQVQHQFNGKSTFTGPLAGDAPLTADNLFSDPANMPAQITASTTYQFSDALTLLGTLAYVQWSTFDEIKLHNVASPMGEIDVAIPEHFRNTWRVAGGAKYRINDAAYVRFGLGWDQTPVNNADRNLRLPDADRLALAIGGHYQATKTIGLDVGWTHIFVKDIFIDNTTNVSATQVHIQGGVKSQVDLFGAQLTWQIS